MIIGIDASRATRARRTGTEAYAYHLITHLLPLTAERYQLRLYFNTPPAPGSFERYAHVEERVLPAHRLWTHLKLARELRQAPPDLFFTPAHVIPLTYRGLSMATVHDLGYEYFPQAHTRSQVAYLRWSTQHNIRRSQLVLADSRATAVDLQRFYGVSEDKIHVLYPGLTPLPEPQPARVAELHASGPYLLFLSTLQPRKNVSRIISAFAQIAARIPHRLLLAGGEGWRAEEILTHLAAQPEPIRQRIERLGYVSEREKVALLAGADILVYPSLYEGFGFPLLEANQLGTAVLASHSSSLPELALSGDKKAALLIDPLDTDALARGLLELVTNVGLRAELIANGRQNVARFSWSRAAQQTVELMQTLLGS